MKINWKSLAPLLASVAPLVTLAIPQLQDAAKGSFWATLVLTTAISIWNHFVTPIHKA